MSYADAQYGLKDKVHDVFKKEIPTVQEGRQDFKIGGTQTYYQYTKIINTIIAWELKQLKCS